MKIDHVSLMVSSLANSMPYYDYLLPLLGFRKLRSHVWQDNEGFVLQFREATVGTSPYERLGAGMNHLGFSAPSAQAVHEVRQAMMAGNFTVPEIQIINTSTALFMKDPDGIRFEVTYYPPGVSVVD